MRRIQRFLQHLPLAIIFASIVFFIMLLALCLVFVAIIVLRHVGVIEQPLLRQVPMFVPLVFISVIIGTILAGILSRAPLAPIRKVIKAMEKITDGDYSVRMTEAGPEEWRNLHRQFNTMAEELGSVEMLRSDFVNNFSHEFKTPIVSIHGFAKMLKRDDLTPEERDEYLDIILQESQRLADLSSNVLNLSNIEKQAILTDKEVFNVSEQIRLVIALMDSKWTDKQINILFDCAEHYVCGNEEMLRQVWINLLDNAIKFSPDGGIVYIDIKQERTELVFTIADQGEAIPPKTAAHIFDRFYQGDTSHAAKGNGLGLTIVEKIVKLHNGSVCLHSSDEDWTVFEVRLPARLPEG